MGTLRVEVWWWVGVGGSGAKWGRWEGSMCMASGSSWSGEMGGTALVLRGAFESGVSGVSVVGD